MATEQSIRRFRDWYATLLRLYPKPYHERFGEPIEQTFNDLLRERAEEEKGLFGFALWMFVETFAGIIRENLTVIIMPKNIIRPALVTALMLLVPFFGNIYIDGWNWDWHGFVFAGTLLFGAGMTYEVIAKKMNNKAYRFAVGLAMVTAFILTWAAMVGAADDNPANALFFGVVSVGLVGAAIAGLKPRGMARAMFAMAFAQMSIPVIVLMVLNSDLEHLRHVPFPGLFAPSVAGVFGVNAFFAVLFIGSALLFRRASASDPDAELTT